MVNFGKEVGVNMKRHCGLLCILLSSVLLLSACGQTSEGRKSTDGGSADSLRVYYVDGNESIQKILYTVKTTCPDITVEKVAFDSAEAMDAQLTTELSAGSAPDVILFTGETTLDTAKMAKSGAFLDLSDYLSTDDTFDAADYYPIFDAGQVDGKQVLMPLAFRLQYLLSTDETLAENGAELNDGYSTKALFDEVRRLAESCDEAHSAMYLMYDTTRSKLLYDALRLTNLPLTDDVNKKLALDRGVFEDYASYIKLFSEQIDKTNALIERIGNNSADAFDLFTFAAVENQIAISTRYYAALFDQILGQKMHIVTIPNHDNSAEITADVSLFAAVPSGSKNPEAAYQILRAAMDTAYASNGDDMSLNKSNVKTVLDDLSGSQGKTFNINGKSVVVPRMDSDLRGRLETILGSIAHGSIINNPVLEIFSDCMRPYIKDEKDFDTCFAYLENKLQLYLYE